jgi:myosin heavy subunit
VALLVTVYELTFGKNYMLLCVVLQIFFRSGVLAQLEAQRDERLTDNVVRLQARCRGYLSRRKLNKLKVTAVLINKPETP